MEPLPTVFESRFLLSIEDSEAGKDESKYLQSENQFLKLFCFFGAPSLHSSIGSAEILARKSPRREAKKEAAQMNHRQLSDN